MPDLSSSNIPPSIQEPDYIPEPQHHDFFLLPLILVFTTLVIAIIIIFILLRNKPTPIPSNLSPQSQNQIAPTDLVIPSSPTTGLSFIDTGQDHCYDNTRSIDCPAEGQSLFGQDAQYDSAQPNYIDNGNGTVTDSVTGLIWQQDPGNKITYFQALEKVKNFNLAGYSDWRIPTIKELYSLIDQNGTDPSAIVDNDTTGLIPFINTKYFKFAYGDPKSGDRIIDSQWVTSTLYNSTVMGDQQCMFGVNFADGRIKCYPVNTGKTFYAIFVRGNPEYSLSSFTDNGNSTITDNTTGLMWQQSDNNKGVNWKDALAYCENLNLAGYTDWRLPNVKELQYIVDYSRSPDITHSPAINSVFRTTMIKNELGQADYPYFWTSTSHLDTVNASTADYISFGRAMGYMNNRWLDVHGAGAQRSDPKAGDPADYPTGHGPQGDAIRIYNYARCVRGGAVVSTNTFPADNSIFFSTKPSATPTLYLKNENTQTSTKQPPQEAITACEGKSPDSSCSFSTRQGDITGTCKNIPDGSFACIP